MATPVERLSNAGLVDVAGLNQDDKNVLEQLTDQEVTVLIQIATRLYPEGRTILKVEDLHHGGIRILVPL